MLPSFRNCTIFFRMQYIMSRTKELIVNSLKYYDTNQEKYHIVFNKFKYYSIKRNYGDTEHFVILFYDKDQKLISQSRYEIVGVYYVNSQIWAWSWSIPKLQKNMVYTTRKILNYGLDIVPTDEDMFIKAELVTSRFKISNEIQLNIHAAIASYIAKKPIVYKLIFASPSGTSIWPIQRTIGENDEIFYLYLLDDID